MRALHYCIAMGLLVSAPQAALAQDRAAEAWESGDYESAAAIWFARAEEGDAEAQYNLAQAFRLGHGVPQSIVRAIEYYRSAAALGQKDAAEQLGLIYYDTPETRRAAVELLRALAAEGRPRAAYIVGLEHMSGQILPYDVEAARHYLQIAANGGVAMALARLQELPAPVVAAPAPVPAPPPAPAALTESTTPSQPQGSSNETLASAFADIGQEPVALSDEVTAPMTDGEEGEGRAPVDPTVEAPVYATSGYEWSVWFGPFDSHAIAGVKIARISARSGLEGDYRVVPVGEDVRIEYGPFPQDHAASLCDWLNERRYYCRGVIQTGPATEAARIEDGEDVQ